MQRLFRELRPGLLDPQRERVNVLCVVLGQEVLQDPREDVDVDEVHGVEEERPEQGGVVGDRVQKREDRVNRTHQNKVVGDDAALR